VLATRHALALLLLLSIACEAPRAPCELAPPELVARSAGLAFDGIATAAASPEHALFAWSSEEGLFVARPVRVPQRAASASAAAAGSICRPRPRARTSPARGHRPALSARSCSIGSTRSCA